MGGERVGGLQRLFYPAFLLVISGKINLLEASPLWLEAKVSVVFYIANFVNRYF